LLSATCKRVLPLSYPQTLEIFSVLGKARRMGAVSICCVLAVHAAWAVAQVPGTFTQTGNLTIPRSFHTATLLPNGKVLIAGGVPLSAVAATQWLSAELYDPSTALFTPTGDMTATRLGQTATLLPTGQVLIAGGGVNGRGGSSAELYDPVTGRFRATGSMNVSRSGHTATLLADGKVLIVGGWYPYPPNPTGAPTYQPADLYDSATETFTTTADLMEPRVDTATLLPNGKVLITAAILWGEGSHVYLYDPAIGIFTRILDLANRGLGARPAAILLPSGKVLFAGGDLGDLGGSASAGVFDADATTFDSVPKMSVTMLAATGTLLAEGRVLIVGGDDVARCSKDPNHCFAPSATPPGTAELYDPVSGTFTAASSAQSEQGHAATLLPDGTVLVSGGEILGTVYPGAQIYHPAVLVPSPFLYSVSAKRQGAILHASTQRLVSPDDPAVEGEALEVYGAGLIDGAVIPPQVAIGRRSAEVLSFGAAPGYVGLNQINVRLPSGIVAGPTVPVRLDYVGRPSNEVTLAVQ
jgi:hypothetical protein